jgi:hypothetical protein
MVARDFMLLHSTQQNTTMPQTLHSQQIVHQQQQHRVQQVQQQPLQQHLGQVHVQQQQQQQHNVLAGTQHVQQLHTNQYQQMELISKASNKIQRPDQSMVQQQQNSVSVASLPTAAPSVVNHMRPPVIHGQDPVSALGHFASHSTQNGQNTLSQNGIAARSHLAQQHQMTRTNGISTLPNDKNGVPGL